MPRRHRKARWPMFLLPARVPTTFSCSHKTQNSLKKLRLKEASHQQKFISQTAETLKSLVLPSGLLTTKCKMHTCISPITGSYPDVSGFLLLCTQWGQRFFTIVEKSVTNKKSTCNYLGKFCWPINTIQTENITFIRKLTHFL